MWLSLVEFRSVTFMNRARRSKKRKERTRAKYNGVIHLLCLL